MSGSRSLMFCIVVLLFQPIGNVSASPVQTYFPLNHGDSKLYDFRVGGTLQYMQLRYTSEQRRTGVYLETDSTDGSQVLYANNGGNLSMPGVIIDGDYLWFATPLVIFSDEVIQNGGTYSSSVNTSYYGTGIYITVQTQVKKTGNIDVPAGTYQDCRSISFSMYVYVQGESGPIVMNDVWTLAPRVGKIEVEVVDQDDNYLDTAKLSSGTIAGKDVTDLMNQLKILPFIHILLK